MKIRFYNIDILRFIFASLALLYLAKGLTGSQFIMNAFFLQCIGYTEQFKGITWYVSPLFWGLLFYYGLFASIRSCSLGMYAYLIYIMQPVGMYWLNKLTPSLSANFGGMWIVVMYSSLLVLLGVVTYYLIEIPGSKLVKNLCFGTYGKR